RKWNGTGIISPTSGTDLRLSLASSATDCAIGINTRHNTIARIRRIAISPLGPKGFNQDVNHLLISMPRGSRSVNRRRLRHRGKSRTPGRQDAKTAFLPFPLRPGHPGVSGMVNANYLSSFGLMGLILMLRYATSLP